ncbi:probable L-type lectin-domain containing receptor kinase S.5 isoform X1 [Oryza sativa Japonica Group]|jgi:serine/threonine protein kinase|uniref:non-specific serine/threonine protein kinase n=1 Tax=Oryza sativa subsp. japonica TaxID=39947 RepID=Q7XUC7_ORYSJ|nr:probable L-type lectin-domain containing receptor kinase S.5 isoform X1 [Oryza sativa Japonica Group]CAD41381.2 OSJNBa0088A01.21 [Oryza sativa Japonica Group]
MAILHSTTFCFSFVASLALIILDRTCSCLQFTYPSFGTPNKADFNFSAGSGIANGSLVITPSTGDISHRSGRVLYARETLKLWNSRRSALTSFRTEFVLNILPRNQTGEGMAFILTNNPELPTDSSGQWLGICNNRTDGDPKNRIVAVEFDTRMSVNETDGNHVGLDINSIGSLDPYPLSNVSLILSSGADVQVRITYNSTEQVLVAILIQFDTTGAHYGSKAWSVDLSQFLFDDVYVGFAGSTGDFTELNQIKSWNFATIDDDITTGRRHGRKVLLPLVAFILFAMSSFLVFLVWRRSTRKRRLAYRNLEKMIDAHGPVKFKLKELRRATANFSSSRKLGRGGFGTVYHGYLSSMNMEVAVKRVAANNKSSSNRGEQEFVAEVNTISKLSHRNLVKLIGWCHEGGELLLVYEYFPMGSLDKLLYGGARPAELTWERRYKIICGVASALEYLHHGSSSRILHRDVKASNVMLDEEYSARLGDFGLARVIHLDEVTHHSTQAVAGTRGYMAYECFFTGRASLDTDVYAFGVFVMEVLTGRSPSSSVTYHNRQQEHDHDGRRQPMYIVDWMWRHYGDGTVLEAADAVLGGAYDEAQVERAARLALACCHPSPRERPSMRTAVQVLVGGAPAPEPPFEKPAFVWPPDGKRQEIELPHVGVLFTGGQLSFCSMTSTSITGR